MSTAEVMTAIHKMSVEKRVQLVEQIWDTIDDETPLELAPDLRRELTACLRDLDENPDEGSSWEEVKARILAQAKRSKSVSGAGRKGRQRKRSIGTRRTKKG